MNECKHLYADWCHKPERCEETQEKCIDYFNGQCPDFEKKCWKCEGSGKLRSNYCLNGTYVFRKVKCDYCNGLGVSAFEVTKTK